MIRLVTTAVLLSGLLAASIQAHEPLFHPIERPVTRPDYLPHPLYQNWVPYRARYNRPRYFPGAFIYHFEPVSQEAYGWHQAVHRGAYKRHAGFEQRKYFYPKPWEMLPIDARPAKPAVSQSSSASK
jgi:hypothetical protein